MPEPARPRRRPRRQRAAIEQAPWRRSRLPHRPTELLSADQIESLHEASLSILEQTGLAVLDEEAARCLRDAGAERRGEQRWRLPRELVLDAVSRAPPHFTLHARNPAHELLIGDGYLNVCSVASAPNASDLRGGRRSGNQRDFRNFLRLTQFFNAVHLSGGYPVEPIDIPPSVRHLECLRDLALLTDKVFHCYSLGRQRNLDAIEITRRARGVDAEQLAREPSLFTVININSPLTLDRPMAQGLMTMAEHGQVSVVTPFTLAGAMAPITLAGALAQQNAEALAGIALTQLVRPGAPVIYGGFTSNVDMRSGAPAFGTPEYQQAAMISGQLARRYRLPFRSSNANAANAADAQAAWESVFALWGAVSGGCNLLMHGAGWLEGGLCASFEKFVIDVELLQMVQAWCQLPAVDDEALALAAIDEVGPGGHFFASDHTQARYEHAFHRPLLADWRNHESWLEGGAPTAPENAARAVEQALAAYREPPIEPAQREAVEDFVARRIAAGGVRSDS